MKVTCNRESLLKAYGAVANIVGKHQKEILNNIKMVVLGNGTATLFSTDMEITMVVPLAPTSLTVEQFGEVLLPVSRVYAVLRESSDDDVTIEDVGTEVHLKTKGGLFKLPSANPMEYPANEFSIDGGYYEMDAAVLQAGLVRTQYATDADSSRYALGGILFDMPESSLVGTDGRRLSCVHVGAELKGKQPDGIRPIIPTRSAGVLCRNLPKDGKIKVSFTMNECTIVSDSLCLKTRLVEGRYPGWQQVIPKHEEWVVDINVMAGNLDSLVRQAAITADTETRGLDFIFGGGNMVASAQSSSFGKSNVSMPVAYVGGEVRVKLDYRYLRDFLGVQDPSDSVRMQVNSSTESVLLTSEQAGHRNVIMPMALER